MNLLAVTIVLPLAGFLLTLAIPKSKPQAIRMFALMVSLGIFFQSLQLIGQVMGHPGGFVFEMDKPWIDTPRIHFHIAIDGVSLWLVILSTLLTPICVLISWKYIQKNVKQFYAFLLLLLCIVFVSVMMRLFRVSLAEIAK